MQLYCTDQNGNFSAKRLERFNCRTKRREIRKDFPLSKNQNCKTPKEIADKFLRKEMFAKTTCEERYLLSCKSSFDKFSNSADWLKTNEAKSVQFYFDFLVFAESLPVYMQRFCWSRKFLLQNGINNRFVECLRNAVTK